MLYFICYIILVFIISFEDYNKFLTWIAFSD